MKKVDIESVIAEINEALDAEQETDDTEQDTDDAVIHFETLIESGDFLDWGQIFSIINNTMRVDIGFNQSHWERILLAHATDTPSLNRTPDSRLSGGARPTTRRGSDKSLATDLRHLVR